MTDTLYRVRLSATAELWAQKHGCAESLLALSVRALAQLQKDDFLEIELPDRECAVFSVQRKTMHISAEGEVSVTLFLDYPAR